MKIIGITGRARSGKDTLADMIVEASGHGIRLSFAEPIREFVARVTGLSVESLTDGPAKETPLPEFGNKSPRQMMQTLGTEWGREMIDQNLWITAAHKRIEKFGRLNERVRPHVVVFSDVRFENEAALIRDMGGLVVHVTRPGAIAVNEHVSEAGVSAHPADILVQNLAGLDHLQAVAKSLAAQSPAPKCRSWTNYG
jgi:hypothetical protein